MRKSSALIAAAFAMLGSMYAANTAAASTQTGKVIDNFLASSTAYCATPQGDSTANGAIITLWVCDGARSQLWHRNANDQLVNDASGKCLTPQGDAYSTNGAILTLWTCNPAQLPSQGWLSLDYPLLNDAFKAMTPYGNRMANGVYLTLWTEASPDIAPVQEWGLDQSW
ncbi:RICIN domain-containing protein [Streptomyces sp. NPDC021020]|uniref:RICIN domain-containing protein n=1 Tax=Streptomyces sp. NPDC021020 TaxID=3365109 RepID=UPI003798D679